MSNNFVTGPIPSTFVEITLNLDTSCKYDSIPCYNLRNLENSEWKQVISDLSDSFNYPRWFL